MSEKDDGGSAFAGVTTITRTKDYSSLMGYRGVFNPDTLPTVDIIKTDGGMSLRDYFAAKAMASDICASANGAGAVHEEALAKWAYAMADAMLAERAK